MSTAGSTTQAAAAPTADTQLELVDNTEDKPDLFARLPGDVAAQLLQCAGGPAALQATRATCRAWQAALDSLVTSAACSAVPFNGTNDSPCTAVLLQLPRLRTVDLSSCCEPLPAGQLPHLLLQLSKLPSLQVLKLSTWLLAVQYQHNCQPGQERGLPAATHHQLLQHAPPAAAATRASAPCYDIIVPDELGLITGLQQLVITTCADVSPPLPRRQVLTPRIMQLPHLTHLELLGFDPAVHHLRGLKHLQHLRVSTPAAAAAGPSAQHAVCTQTQSADACQKALSAVDAATSLRSIQIDLAASCSPFTWPHGQALLSKLCGQLLLCDQLLSRLPAAVTDPVASHASSHSTASSSSHSSSTASPLQTAPRPAAATVVPFRRPQLQQLLLRHAGALHHLPPTFTRVFAGLQELDLSHCALSTDAAVALAALSSLTSLSLAECALQELPHSWVHLTGLQVLNLGHNSLSQMPPYLSRLQGLMRLLLPSSHLRELPTSISCLTALEHLDLASNKLQELPSELCSCSSLQRLDVSKNRLLALPEHFSSLTRVTHLNVTGNHLEAVPPGLHHLAHLAHLGLALNYYKAWCHALPCFDSLASSLQELQLQHTATVLDDAAGFLEAVGRLTALTSLCAGSNQLSSLPGSWTALKRLQVLQLSHNAMQELPVALLSLTGLTHLDLSYNRLTALPFWVGSSKLQRLRRLNLAKNHLTTLPPEVSGLSQLTQLTLQGNNLASLPPCLGALNRLRLLNIGGNYKLKEGGLGQQLAAVASLRDVVLPYRLGEAAAELRAAGKAVQLD